MSISIFPPLSCASSTLPVSNWFKGKKKDKNINNPDQHNHSAVRLKNKRPMGHITHLRKFPGKKQAWFRLWLYKQVVNSGCYLPLKRNMAIHLNKLEFLSFKDVLCQLPRLISPEPTGFLFITLFESGPVVLQKMYQKREVYR